MALNIYKIGIKLGASSFLIKKQRWSLFKQSNMVYMGHIMLLLKCKCSQNQWFYKYFSILSPWQRLTYQKSANIRYSYSSKKVVPLIYVSTEYTSSVKIVEIMS